MCIFIVQAAIIELLFEENRHSMMASWGRIVYGGSLIQGGENTTHGNDEASGKMVSWHSSHFSMLNALQQRLRREHALAVGSIVSLNSVRFQYPDAPRPEDRYVTPPISPCHLQSRQ
jgi:hypothetical protein